jgi:hypothetical protein
MRGSNPDLTCVMPPMACPKTSGNASVFNDVAAPGYFGQTGAPPCCKQLCDTGKAASVASVPQEA